MVTPIHRPRILVLTHNFPRFENDISGIGFQPLYRALSKYLDLHFVVPHDAGLKDFEQVGNLHVHRFRYASDADETLAYRGEMHQRVLRQPLLAASFFQAYKDKGLELVDKVFPKAIWAHWWLPGGLVGRAIARRTDLPFVITCHGTDIHLLKKYSWIKPLARYVFKYARSINVVSSYLEQTLLSQIDDSTVNGKTFVAPLISDSKNTFYDPRVRRRDGSIISASRFTKQKHLDTLIKAIKNVVDSGTPCTLTLYGDGPEEAALRALVSDLNLNDVVKFHPPVTQDVLGQRYRESDIVALVSEREGYGMTLVEAMMCGCAAIGANSGGITDIITRNGEDGLLVEPGDVDSLTEALKKFLTNDEYRQSIAAKGRVSVAARFSEKELTNLLVSRLLPQSRA